MERTTLNAPLVGGGIHCECDNGDQRSSHDKQASRPLPRQPTIIIIITTLLRILLRISYNHPPTTLSTRISSCKHVLWTFYLHLVSHVDGSTRGTYLRQGMPADDVVIVPVKLYN